MVRARLTSLALATSLAVLSGCSMSSGSNNTGSGFFSFLHPSRSRTADCPMGCDCCEETVGMAAPYGAAGCSSGACSASPLIGGHPSMVQGPSLFPPSPTPLIFPGNGMPPAAMIAPRPAPLPTVVTIPQAATSPSPP